LHLKCAAHQHHILHSSASETASLNAAERGEKTMQKRAKAQARTQYNKLIESASDKSTYTKKYRAPLRGASQWLTLVCSLHQTHKLLVTWPLHTHPERYIFIFIRMHWNRQEQRESPVDIEIIMLLSTQQLVRLCFCFLSLWRVLRLFQARALERQLRMCNQRRWNWILLYLLWAMRADWWRWYDAGCVSRVVFRQMKQVRYAWRRPTSYLIYAKVCTLWHRGYVNDCVDDHRAAKLGRRRTSMQYVQYRENAIKFVIQLSLYVIITLPG
jgi:hypothetical protein